MVLDWQMIGTVLVGVVQLVGLVGAYYGLKADNAKLASTMEVAMLREREARLSSQATDKAELIAIISKLEGYVHDLTHRVSTLESGQDEWTKSLRSRTHELADAMQVLVLRVDRLERPLKET